MLSELVRPALASGYDSSSSGEEWRCADCDRAFASERALGQHCRATGHDPADSSSGSGSEEWRCADCDRTFASERALGQHCRATGHDPADSSSGSGSDWTSVCDSDGASDDSGSDGGWFHCRTCRRGFGTRRSLLQHSSAKGH